MSQIKYTEAQIAHVSASIPKEMDFTLPLLCVDFGAEWGNQTAIPIHFIDFLVCWVPALVKRVERDMRQGVQLDSDFYVGSLISSAQERWIEEYEGIGGRRGDEVCALVENLIRQDYVVRSLNKALYVGDLEEVKV